MANPKRVGADDSKTRHRLLDCVEEQMVESGHASVTYRAVAARAGVSSSLVQYYFPTLDEMLVAAVRRRTEQSLDHLADLLRARPHRPLRTLWEFSSDETTAALAFEFSALGIHRESVRAITVEYLRQLRRIQLDVLATAEEKATSGAHAVPAPALLFLLSGIPKLIQLEAVFDVETGHREIVDLVERYLDANEPT